MNTEKAAALPPRPTRSSPKRALAEGSHGWVLPVVVIALVAASGPALSPYITDLFMKVMTLALFALSLELLVGMTGLVSLGHAAFFGVGAYATVLGSGQDGASMAYLIPLAMLSAALYALFVGALSLRTSPS